VFYGQTVNESKVRLVTIYDGCASLLHNNCVQTFQPGIPQFHNMPLRNSFIALTVYPLGTDSIICVRQRH